MESVILLEEDYNKIKKYMFSRVWVESINKYCNLCIKEFNKKEIIKVHLKQCIKVNSGSYLYNQLVEFFGEDIKAMINRAMFYLENI